MVGDQRLDAAHHRHVGPGEGRGRVAVERDERREARHRLVAGGRDRDAERRHLALRRLGPGGIDAPRLAPLLQHAVAVAQGAFQRRHARAVLAVDREHDAVEEAAALGRRAGEEPVHGGRQPDDAQVVGEALGGRHGRAIDAASARGRRPRAGEFEAGAELRGRDFAGRILDLDRDGPAATAAVPRAVGEFRPAETAARGEEGQGLEQVGLAGAVEAGERHGRPRER